MTNPDQAEADEIAARRPDVIKSGRLCLTDPRTAGDWLAIKNALLVDAESWTTLADQTGDQIALPRIVGEDYAIRLSRAYREMARAAFDAAATAELCACDLAATG